MAHVIELAVSFTLGIGGGTIVSLVARWAVPSLRRSKVRSSDSVAGARRRGQSARVRVGVASLLDPTGVSVYALMRDMLRASHPEGTAPRAFRSSARTMADAYEEATRDR
jgi:hypothetical protein